MYFYMHMYTVWLTKAARVVVAGGDYASIAFHCSNGSFGSTLNLQIHLRTEYVCSLEYTQGQLSCWESALNTRLLKMTDCCPPLDNLIHSDLMRNLYHNEIQSLLGGGPQNNHLKEHQEIISFWVWHEFISMSCSFQRCVRVPHPTLYFRH